MLWRPEPPPGDPDRDSDAPYRPEDCAARKEEIDEVAVLKPRSRSRMRRCAPVVSTMTRGSLRRELLANRLDSHLRRYSEARCLKSTPARSNGASDSSRKGYLTCAL